MALSGDRHGLDVNSGTEVWSVNPPGGPTDVIDQQTGAAKWSFNSVKDGDLWGHPEVISGGGA